MPARAPFDKPQHTYTHTVGVGKAVAVSANGLVIVGAPEVDLDAASEAGAAYVFACNATAGTAVFKSEVVAPGTPLAPFFFFFFFVCLLCLGPSGGARLGCC